MKTTRENSARVREIEEQIGKLTAELLTLVLGPKQEKGGTEWSDAQNQELWEARIGVYEDIRETDPDMVGDLDAVWCILDNRELAVEEAIDHLRHGREDEAQPILDELETSAEELMPKGGQAPC